MYETGGIFVDHGWLRHLGSGNLRLPRSLPEWTSQMTGWSQDAPPPFLLIADDVVGGFFAIDGGGLGLGPGNVGYFAPDTMRWDSLGMGHTQFVQWCLSDRLADFYKDYRWSGWEEEVEGLGGTRAFSIYPPPVFRGEPFPHRSRRAVPVDQLYRYYQDLARQLEEVPDGAQIQLRLNDDSSWDAGGP